jgi:hypothetical protein
MRGLASAPPEHLVAPVADVLPPPSGFVRTALGFTRLVQRNERLPSISCIGVASPQLAGEIFGGHRELDFFREPAGQIHHCGRSASRLRSRA